ncbi:MAG: FAD:protein FMN transferase, partial [Candidatus Sumerlaeota bacterium]|nr:FAD:protein FMN transferase [Candidatus Sumerlaeota bacterium]
LALSCSGKETPPAASAPAPDNSVLQQTIGGETMGSKYTVKYITPLHGDAGKAEYEKLADAIQDCLDRIEGLTSLYRPDTELSRFNASTQTTLFKFSKEAFEIFQMSQIFSEKTGGAYDVTVAPLVAAYGFGPKGRKGAPPPNDRELAALRQRVGYHLMVLDAAHQTVTKKRSDIECDLNAISDGYGADKVAEVLEAHSIHRYMAEVCGEVRAAGVNLKGKPWQIGVEMPLENGGAFDRVISLNNTSVSTSGDYRNFYIKDGKRISHTIDARTGHAIEHNLASASVIHPVCAVADGWSTAFMALGPDEGFALAEKEHLAALFIIRKPDGKFYDKETPEFTALAPKK